MDSEDIRNYRRWHREAALAREEGRLRHRLLLCRRTTSSLAMHFLQRRRNHRTDEYGGSLENRVRLFREMIEDTKEAVGDTCGVVVRFAVDEMLGPDGITSDERGRATSSRCWRSCRISGTSMSATGANDSATSRFAEEGYQERIRDVREDS